MALSQGRMTKRRDAVRFEDPVAASTTIHTGALVCTDASGNAVPGSVSTTLVTRGVALEGVSNPGAAGAEKVKTERGCFNFKNHGADLVVRADIGKACYIVDDETVAKTNGTNTRSVAGIVRDIDVNGVWVEI